MKPILTCSTDKSGMETVHLVIPLPLNVSDAQKREAGYLFNRAAKILGAEPVIPKRVRGRLTATQNKIACLIMMGLSNDQICFESKKQMSCIKFHITNLKQEFHAKDRAELIDKMKAHFGKSIKKHQDDMLPVGFK